MQLLDPHHSAISYQLDIWNKFIQYRLAIITAPEPNRKLVSWHKKM